LEALEGQVLELLAYLALNQFENAAGVVKKLEALMKERGHLDCQ
jgi:hypothetical protein